jgi:hypothetical protein
MRKTAFVLTLIFQLFLTFATLFVIYIVYALLDVDEVDLISGLGFIVFQPLLGFGLTGLTVLICLIAGLPLRLITKVRQWWLTKPLLPVLGASVGLFMLLLSFHSNLTETKQVILNGETIDKEVPNTPLSITGWFLIAFCLLHFYPQTVLSIFRRRQTSSSITNTVAEQKPSV